MLFDQLYIQINLKYMVFMIYSVAQYVIISLSAAWSVDHDDADHKQSNKQM